MGRSDDRPWLPTGTVTFLFTDIEGSTRLLQDLGDRYEAVRDEHAAILRRAIRDGGGVEVSAERDLVLRRLHQPGGGGPVRGGRPAVYAAACNHQ
jgi:class 3 adenylate cyclase